MSLEAISPIEPINPAHNHNKKDPEFNQKNHQNKPPQEEPASLDTEAKIRLIQEELQQKNNREGWVG